MRKDTKKGPRKNLARTLLSIVNYFFTTRLVTTPFSVDTLRK